VNLGQPVPIEAKDDGGGGDSGAISRAKLQPNHHHQQTNIQFFLQAGCPSCWPTNSVKALKGKQRLFTVLMLDGTQLFLRGHVSVIGDIYDHCVLLFDSGLAAVMFTGLSLSLSLSLSPF